MSPSVEGRRRLESGASVTVERFVGRSQSLTAGATGEINNNLRYYQRIMAKRKYSAMKRNKIEPSVLTLTFATPGSGAARSYIDLSQVASLVNRRFYRQGINWAVAGFKLAVNVQDL